MIALLQRENVVVVFNRDIKELLKHITTIVLTIIDYKFMNNNFTTILYHGHIPTILTDYLKWYEILPLILVNVDTKKNIHHPFIRQARRHYKIKDGANLSLKQAEKILVKTRENLGSELVETAILENLDGLSCFNNIKFNQIEYYLNNS